jgi:hypothetical protein
MILLLTRIIDLVCSQRRNLGRNYVLRSALRHRSIGSTKRHWIVHQLERGHLDVTIVNRAGNNINPNGDVAVNVQRLQPKTPA